MAVQDDSASITTLLNNVRNDRIDVVKKSLILYGLPKSDAETTDYFILQTALRWHHREIAKLLIEAGCRVKPAPTDNGITPLGLAFQTDDYEIALMILKKGTTRFVDNRSKANVLHVAAERRSLKMLELALNYKIDANLLDNKGKTALQILLENDNHSKLYHETNKFLNIAFLGFKKYSNSRSKNRLEELETIEMIELLLSKGASVDFKLKNNETVLHYVVLLKQQTLIELVLQRIRHVNLRDDEGETALHVLLYSDFRFEHDVLEIVKLFIEKGADIDIVDFKGVTVCHLAAAKKYFKIMNLFLQCQCNVSLQDDNGNTILHRLLENSSHCSQEDICSYFVNSTLYAASLENILNSSRKTPLHLAAENCQYKILEVMLPKFINVNIIDENGETLMHILLRKPSNASCDILKCLLYLKARVDMKNAYGETPLDLAFKSDNTSFLLLMIPHSKHLKKCNFRHNKSVLHYLSNIEVDSENEELEVAQVAEICIAKGARVEVVDNSFRISTPLYLAVLNQRKNMVEVLLKHGADPNFDIFGSTVIEHLISKPTVSNVDIIIAHNLASRGASTNVTIKGFLSFLNNMDINLHEARLLVTKLLKNHENQNVTDSCGNTILHAFLNPNMNTDNIFLNPNHKNMCEDEDQMIKIVALLLKNRISVDTKNNQGITALHLSAKNKYLLVSELLLKNGADIALLDNKGNSVLHFASMLNVETNGGVEKNLIDLFVAKGCDLNAQNKLGMTPLLTAAESGCVNAIRAFISHGADFKHTSDESISDSLHTAIEYDYHPVFIEYLLECGAYVYKKRKDGKTALHIAAIHGRYEIMKIFLKKMIYLDVRDNEGRTALHLACWYENNDVAIYLLNMGADVNALDNLRITPLMMTSPSFDNALWITLQEHVRKLENAGVSIPAENVSCVKNYRKQLDAKQLVNEPQLEVLKMQKTMIDNRTLIDVLNMKLDKLAIFHKNRDFVELLRSENFQLNFPGYNFLITACYFRGVIRSKLVRKAQKALSQLLQSSILNVCVEEIFKYLDNDNLINLAQAAQLKVKGRKRVFSGKEEHTPLKKVCGINE